MTLFLRGGGLCVPEATVVPTLSCTSVPSSPPHPLPTLHCSIPKQFPPSQARTSLETLPGHLRLAPSPSSAGKPSLATRGCFVPEGPRSWPSPESSFLAHDIEWGPSSAFREHPVLSIKQSRTQRPSKILTKSAGVSALLHFPLTQSDLNWHLI